VKDGQKMIRYLIISLFCRGIAAQSSYPCYVCLSPQFHITKPDVAIYTGQVNKMWKCGEFETMAKNGEFGRDVCSIVQGYALRDCGCDDGLGSPPPEQPVIDFGVMCNVCGGEGGSDMDQVSYPEAFVDTGVGVSATCEFLYVHGFKGAFTSGQCATIQNTVRGPCGCGPVVQVPQTPAPVTVAPTVSPTVSPTESPPIYTPPPTQGATTQSPVTLAPFTLDPTMAATTPAPIPEVSTQAPVAATEPATPPTMTDIFGAIPSAQLPTASAFDSTNQLPTYAVNTQDPTVSIEPTEPPVSTMPPTIAPTENPTKLPTSEPSGEPTKLACLESGEACDKASDCCLGLCDYGLCSVEVLTLTTPVTSSTSPVSYAVGLFFACAIFALFT